MEMISLIGVNIMMKGKVLKSTSKMLVEIQFRGVLPKDLVEIYINPNSNDIQKQVIKKLLHHYTELEYYPTKGIDVIRSKAFLKSVEESQGLIGLTDKEIRAPSLYVRNTYLVKRKRFENMLQEILLRLKSKGFKVELNEKEEFLFTFVNRYHPLKIHIPNYGKNSNSMWLKEDSDIIEFYDEDDIINTLREKLTPLPGKKYVKKFLDTYSEFQSIMGEK